MSLLSAILPVLETLPGYPSVDNPSLMDVLWVILIVPAGIAALIAAALLGPRWARRGEDAEAEPDAEGARTGRAGASTPNT